MRIYREHYTGKDGKRKTCEKWYLDFRDHRGRRRKMPGFKEKRKTEYFANHVESLVSCRGAGQSIPSDLQAWIERLPEQTPLVCCWTSQTCRELYLYLVPRSHGQQTPLETSRATGSRTRVT